MLLHLCATGMCTPGEENRLAVAFEACRYRSGELVECMAGQLARPYIYLPPLVAKPPKRRPSVRRPPPEDMDEDEDQR